MPCTYLARTGGQAPCDHFAPAKNLKVLLTEEWFGMLTTDEKPFAEWITGYVKG